MNLPPGSYLLSVVISPLCNKFQNKLIHAEGTAKFLTHMFECGYFVWHWKDTHLGFLNNNCSSNIQR
jgi:hypothetical protein